MPQRRTPVAATGLALFAGLVLFMAGGFQILQGLAGVVRANQLTGTDLLLEGDAQQWGWAHVAIGVVTGAIGIGVLAGTTWGRWGGITIAIAAMMTQFLALPIYPLWSLVVIAALMAVVWALAVYDPRHV